MLTDNGWSEITFEELLGRPWDMGRVMVVEKDFAYFYRVWYVAWVKVEEDESWGIDLGDGTWDGGLYLSSEERLKHRVFFKNYEKAEV